MATHLDLEEQEQLDQLKHFWNRFGTLITILLVLAFAAVAGWRGYQYYSERQSTQAAALYDAIETAAKDGDVARVEQAFKDIQDKYPATTFAQQAGLMAAKALLEKDKPDAAKAALTWVAEKASDDGLAALARVRLAAILTQQQAYDQALAQLNSKMPASFAALAADGKGDAYLLQGKPDEARKAYLQAYKDMPEQLQDYRRIVEAKLNQLGVDAQEAANASPAGAKS